MHGIMQRHYFSCKEVNIGVGTGGHWGHVPNLLTQTLFMLCREYNLPFLGPKGKFVPTPCSLIHCRSSVLAETLIKGLSLTAADVRLFLVPTIDQDLEIATVGVDYVLTCRLITFQSESGQATFVWEDPDGTIFTQEDTRFVTATDNENTTLEFRPPQEFHAGEYKCTAVFGSFNVPTTALVQVKRE